MNEMVLSAYKPGVIGKIAEMHGTYYAEHWRFGLYFEAKVAKELAEFLMRFNEAHDGFWVAWNDDEMIGAIAIDGGAAEGARLRWFIVHPEYQRRGIGRRLIAEAIAFCDRCGFRRVYLTTFAGLDAARHLYEAHGFRLIEEVEGSNWGETVTEQVWERLR